VGFLDRLVLGAPMRRIAALREQPGALQDRVACELGQAFADSAFGRAHDLARVSSAQELSRRFPIREHAALVPFFERPRYWGITSGTSGSPKAIPVSARLLRESSSGIGLVFSSLLAKTESLGPLFGKILYIGASTPLTVARDGVLSGPITSLAVHHMSPLARASMIPGQRLDALPDWDAKMAALVEMARTEDVRMVSGMPPWLLSFAQRMEKAHGVRNLHEIWPRLAFVVHAGTSPEPYRAELEERYGPAVFRNVYTSTEAFLAFQDSDEPGLLPMADSVFLEFVPLDELTREHPTRVLLTDVELDVEYAVVCSTFSGMFGYLLGDTVRFVSRSPLRLMHAGRVHRRLNVAGEKVATFDIERTMTEAARELGVAIAEACVVPRGPALDQPAHHLWLIESACDPARMGELATALDRQLQACAPFYRARREGETAPLGPPRIRLLAPGAFQRWLSSAQRLGGQQKIPRILDAEPKDLC
jgi:acyl-CoA synthetase (AMP-forming)/AMP-acid ligase II